MLRVQRLKRNTFSSLFFQIATIVCGFIVPRLILWEYGSSVNGLVNSIAQFLQIIAFLELGVGSVVQSALYRPLVNKNQQEVSTIVNSAERFFRKIAIILLGYISVMIIIYPMIVIREFDSTYTIMLICAIGVSFFSQYYFGVVDRLVLIADQRGYISYNTQTITLISNTVLCVCLIKLETSIQIVKLFSSLIYLLRPLFLRMYVNKHYDINRNMKYKGEPIKQKWNGMAQHVAAIVLDNTDTVVLTVFSTLSNVSIYSVYHLVVLGIKQLLLSTMSGVQALMGELWAKKEYDTLGMAFEWIEWAIHTMTTYIFGCTLMLIWPFVKVYTNGIGDVDYYHPLFALLLVLANAGHCYRLPYNMMILAAGHYKQTQGNYIIASLLNVFISIVTVKQWGLIGVAIGTLVAMIYQTIWMAYYDSKNFTCCFLKNFIKHMLIDAFIFVVGCFATKGLKLLSASYVGWGVLAIKVAAIWIGISGIVNCIFCYDKIYAIITNVKRGLYSKHIS